MTKAQKSLSNKFLAYKFLTNMWFVGAVWLYFYRIFISDREVGILDGLAFAIGLVAEVPSGALADKFGRDKMLKAGQLLSAIGLIIQAAGSSFLPFVVGQAVLMIGVAFISGADEALFFDQLKFSDKSPDWRKLITRGSQVSLVASTLAVIGGGLLHDFNPRLPWIFTSFSFFLSALLVWNIKENRPDKVKKAVFDELKDQLVDIKSGFTQFLKPNLFLYVPIIIVVQGLYYAAGWGLLRMVLLDRFQFSPFIGSLVLSSTGIITVVVLDYFYKKAEKLSEKKVIVLISLSVIGSLLFSIPNIGALGYFVILILRVGEYILQPFMSEVLNYRTDPKQRATVLSVSSFLRTLPYLALAPIIGWLNTNDKLEYFLFAWAVLVVAAVVYYLSLKKKDDQISLAKIDVSDTTDQQKVPELVVD